MDTKSWCDKHSCYVPECCNCESAKINFMENHIRELEYQRDLLKEYIAHLKALVTELYDAAGNKQTL